MLSFFFALFYPFLVSIGVKSVKIYLFLSFFVFIFAQCCKFGKVVIYLHRTNYLTNTI